MSTSTRITSPIDLNETHLAALVSPGVCDTDGRICARANLARGGWLVQVGNRWLRTPAGGWLLAAHATGLLR